jgi:hypothetical protein
MLWVRPEKLQRPFRVTVNVPCITGQTVDFLILGRLYHDHRGHVRDGQTYTMSFKDQSELMHVQLIWSLSTANGVGDLISQASTAQGSTLRWNSLYGLQSFMSAYVSGCLGQSGRFFPPLSLRKSHE